MSKRSTYMSPTVQPRLKGMRVLAAAALVAAGPMLGYLILAATLGGNR
ncbi:hypothetical protein [Leifsonia sp. WHRI 6310E]